jgi:hypothetical protein
MPATPRYEARGEDSARLAPSIQPADQNRAVDRGGDIAGDADGLKLALDAARDFKFVCR